MKAPENSSRDESDGVLASVVGCLREHSTITRQTLSGGPRSDQQLRLAAGWRRLLRLRAFLGIQLGHLERQARRLDVRRSLGALDDALFEGAVEDGDATAVRSAIKRLSAVESVSVLEARRQLQLARERWSPSLEPTTPDELRVDVIRIGPGAVASGRLWPALPSVRLDQRDALADALEEMEHVLCVDGSLASVLVWSAPSGSWYARPLTNKRSVGPLFARAYTLAALPSAGRDLKVEQRPVRTSLATPTGPEPAWKVWSDGARQLWLLEDLTFAAVVEERSTYTLGGRRWELSEALQGFDRL